MLGCAILAGCGGSMDPPSPGEAPLQRMDSGSESPGSTVEHSDATSPSAVDSDTPVESAAPIRLHPAGAPGCGLPAAAFCDTFDAPSMTRGRARDLDPALWSAGRLAPQ